MAILKPGAIDRRILAGSVILAAIVAALLYFGVMKPEGDRPQRPVLHIMSSIPLQWGDATMTQVASGEAQPSPLFEALAEKNRAVVIDDFQKLDRTDNIPLLLIQPRALAPRELVQLDEWIGKGGVAIIFADPVLDWPSEYPLGDRRRPLFTSLLNPLFGHWGLQLALPTDVASEAQATAAGQYALSTKSAGIWVKGKNATPAAQCVIREDELIAYCSIGKGKALLIADADILQDAQWTDSIVSSGTIAWLNAVISAARTNTSITPALWETRGN